MATVSASQPISTITPPHSSDGRTSWDYAVPLDHENVALNDARLATTTSTNQHSNYDSRQPSIHERNGIAKRTNTMELNNNHTTKTSQSVDLRHPGKLTWKTSNLSGAEQNGYGDPYRAGTGGTAAPDNKRKQRNADPEYDDSKWIHRDKLAQIESKELEEAGFRVPRKTMSRATSSRSSSQHRPEKLIESPQFESPAEEDFNNGTFAQPADKRQRTVSPSRVIEEDINNVMDFEIRTPEEVASERELMARYAVRPGTSRIPVKKFSALPVPPAFVERDAPLPRSRGDSVGWTGTSEGFDASNEQGANAGNESAIDDEPSTPPATFSTDQAPTQHSPPKARVPTKANPTSAARKVSNSTAPRKISATTQSRNVSTNSPTKRPGTSSGRPSTSHPAPEGDPPWITSMYKPDPRLPPDQQILPTHAKRLAQEQWEKEGKTGTVYDRDFRLLNDEAPIRPERLSAISANPPNIDDTISEHSPKKEPHQIWPLAPPLQQRSSAAMSSTGRPGTSGTDHGGYSIMPTLNSPKLPGSPAPALSPKPIEVMRMQDPESGPQYQELEKKKGGCGCCVVM